MKKVNDRCIIEGHKGTIVKIYENEHSWFSVGIGTLLYDIEFDDEKISNSTYTNSYFKTINELREDKLKRIIEE